MSIDEVDELFYLLENPTRRRILQLLSVERLYPLQLSREIDVTQQAVAGTAFTFNSFIEHLTPLTFFAWVITLP